ncbi:MAG: penicillin-binding protein 1C [Proteobacteria bacterium]|nr:penicillin-binding protein 1C [Pseudomonadota bacterium]
MKAGPFRRAGVALAVTTAALALGVLVLLALPVSAPRYGDVRAAFVPSDAFLLDRHGAVIDSRRLRFDVRREPWVPLDEISPALVQAIVAGEDQRFWRRGAVDWESAAGAVRDELIYHRRRGASTIPMQLASLLGHRHGTRGAQALLDKIRQVQLARALSAHWSRDEILEAYLNLLEYRGELQGIGAAAAELAGKTPAGLTQAESLVLAALLPQPQADQGRVVVRACARARALPAPVDCAAVQGAAREVFAGGHEPARVHLAPQLAQQLLRHPGERVQTSLDAGLQRQAMTSVRTQLALLAGSNVRDGAALVVDNESGEVLAYVGSAASSSRAAEVDGVRAPRQAGSTLKPFLYELALERRYLTAGSLLSDSPLSVDTAGGLYIPQDYDHDFKGLVSVRTALAGSLNVPAVRTLVLTGVESFRDRLHELGYGFVREDGAWYGYSLALGSAEVSLWQQAQAYRTLARGGQFAPLTLSAAGKAAARPLLDPAATFVVGDMLADPAARAVTFGLDSHLVTPFWSAVKTGTSEDMRDNWCIGFSRHYTVAVWVGNFEGDSMHAVSGVTGAAPIWREILTTLERGGQGMAPAAPAGVSAVAMRFAPAIEPPRREWFLGGTEPRGRESALVPKDALPRIDSPADGMVVALDPDIPPLRQRVLIAVSGVRAGLTLRLNDELLGPAQRQLLWRPRSGTFRLRLQDERGQTVSDVHFTVRGNELPDQG